MKAITTKAALLSVALIGSSVGTVMPALANPASDEAATSVKNEALAEAIRVQGEQALASITRQIKADLMQSARTLAMPSVRLGPTRLVKTEQDSAKAWGSTSAKVSQAQLGIWLKAMLSNNERDLYHALSLARFIIIDVPAPVSQ